MRIETGYGTVEEALTVDELVESIRKLEAELKKDGATSISIDYQERAWEDRQYLTLTGYRESTPEEDAAEKRRLETAKQQQATYLQRQLDLLASQGITP